MDEGLGERLFKFTIDVLTFLSSLPKNPEAQIIRYQLAKASSSSGANYEEAQAASSKADFANKMKIVLREMRESNYWLRICIALKFGNEAEANKLKKESTELKNILGSICSKL
ncbi:MAG: four helix bundle protein [Ignavibacteriaceae bacterium]|nr:four helix bundle protein [Ignavibacteriaceae bacterium]